MTEDDFINLRVHLNELRPVVESFCCKHEFIQMPWTSIGRYPRIRFKKVAEITIWFDIWMAMDATGNRFEIFFPEIPYELSAGASFIEKSSLGDEYRYSNAFLMAPVTPFNQVINILPDALEENLKKMITWDKSYIRNNGTCTKFNRAT